MTVYLEDGTFYIIKGLLLMKRKNMHSPHSVCFKMMNADDNMFIIMHTLVVT